MTIKSIFKIITQLLFDHRQKAIVHVSIEAIQPNSILKGRTALITGGTSGIGLSIAMAYAKSGASVIITGRDGVRLSSAVQKLKTQNNDATICSVEWDATKVSSFEDKFKTLCEVLNQKGVAPIDILVNNAGVNCKGMPNATEAEYDKVLDTNLKGVFFLSQMIGKYWVSNGIRGNILNIASASSLRPADSAYILSKWGLRGLTLGLAKSLAKHGITVNGIAPGPTATPMVMKDNRTNLALERLPLGRYITPEEISNMALILVSGMGRSIMGDIVYMTGGAGLLTYDDVPYSF